MKTPQFIIVGAAKAGTTSLYRYLQQHPDIHLPEVKEPHYFTSDQSYSFDVVSDWDDYVNLFEEAGDRMTGEASTGYLYFNGTAKRIKEKLPQCKIIIMTRDPAAIAFSMWGHQVREGLEKQSFCAAITDELANGTRINNGVSYGFNYVQQARISDNISQFLCEFGEQQVLICSLEEMRCDPNKVMQRVFGFLGVTTNEEICAGKTHNASGVPASVRLHAFLNSKSRVRKALVAPLKLVLSDTQRHALWARLRDRNIQRGKRHEMDGLSRQLLESALVQERTALKRLNNYLE